MASGKIGSDQKNKEKWKQKQQQKNEHLKRAIAGSNYDFVGLICLLISIWAVMSYNALPSAAKSKNPLPVSGVCL